MINDKSLHAFCMAAIKKSTVKPYDFKYTSFYEHNSDFPYPDLQITWNKDELFVCSVVIDHNNFSILTTQRLLTKQNGQLYLGRLKGATSKSVGDLRDHRDKDLAIGIIQLQNGNELPYFIETRYASMVIAHGIRTLLQANDMTAIQVEKVTRIWTKRYNLT